MAVILVQVIRSPGDVQAEDIIDPLCTTEAVAVERGRIFIDSNYMHKLAVTGKGPHSEWMAPGSLIDVIGHSSPSYKSMLVGINISVARDNNEVTFDTSVKLERLYDE